jgi:hypothetical protein
MQQCLECSSGRMECILNSIWICLKVLGKATINHKVDSNTLTPSMDTNTTKCNMDTKWCHSSTCSNQCTHCSIRIWLLTNTLIKDRHLEVITKTKAKDRMVLLNQIKDRSNNSNRTMEWIITRMLVISNRILWVFSRSNFQRVSS